ncbi:hypothetical protein [Chthonobacter albigriseus]|uniref:hypothetical protein n=1 Tax=Chthonobacter albigriseus TaxID=1683161 RepID=UPI0031407326
MLGALLLVGGAGPALAHGSERGFVMLLPTGHVMAGGAAAVAASFLAAALIPERAGRAIAAARLRLGTVPAVDPTWTSTLSAVIVLALVAVGFLGYPDPLTNPLPLSIWTVWWVGFPLAHAVFGNLWAYLNPLTGPYRLLDRWLGGELKAAARPLPAGLGYWPAIGGFLLFAWFELVSLKPDEPETLATAVSIYLILSFACLATFGEEDWMGRGDPFAPFFRFVARLSPLVFERRDDGRVAVVLALPGAGLVHAKPMPVTGVAYVLLTLATVSFDGFSKTFTWLSFIGINPLEFPGRSAVTGANTAGLLAAFAVLAGVFFAATAIGWAAAGRPGRYADAAGRAVLSVVPISIAFHLAHYLTALLVNGQYALLAANDPLGLGANLLGLRGMQVTTSFLTSAAGSTRVFAVQTGVIVVGHVVAVVAAHLAAAAVARSRREALAIEAPLAAVMVGYTAFGLWLLSTPTAG